MGAFTGLKLPLKRPEWIFDGVRITDSKEEALRKQVWKPEMNRDEFWNALTNYKIEVNKKGNIYGR